MNRLWNMNTSNTNVLFCSPVSLKFRQNPKFVCLILKPSLSFIESTQLSAGSYQVHVLRNQKCDWGEFTKTWINSVRRWQTPGIIAFVLDGYLHQLNVANVTNVLNVTIKKEKKYQKTIHMLESCSYMRWELKSRPLECCECNECTECNN